MRLSKNDTARLREILRIPGFIVPRLDRFFTRQEVYLVLLLADGPLRIGDIAARWAGAECYRDLNHLQDFLDRSCKRGIVSRCDKDRFQPADFHARFDNWALFEGWMDLPDAIKDQLNSWELEDYIRRHANQVNVLKNGRHRDPTLTWPEYVLLPEAMTLIDQADHIYLWPCNCRAMMGRCAKNVYTCLRFSNQRDMGWEISNTRAKEILIQANKQGLMQNAEISIYPNGSFSGAICNCCADCCFPHQLAEQQAAGKLWPLTRYVADHHIERCTSCGNCVKRCPFKAFTYGVSKPARKSGSFGPQKEKRAILYDSSLCRGCGVCSTGCPDNAIEMVRLEHVESAWQSRLNIFL